MSDFFQQGPVLKNTFLNDTFFIRLLKQFLPQDLYQEIFKDLENLGALASGPLLRLAQGAELHPPEHIPFDAFGNRIDQIWCTPEWEELKKIASEQQLIRIAYQRKQKEFSRLYQFAKLYLFHPSSAFFSCPLAMTDGAARVLELHKNQEWASQAFEHLTSDSLNQFWISGQWMTEKSGGSDVSQTETEATPSGDHFLLNGTKWFTSAITSEMALGLARIKNSKTLSLFYIPVRLNGSLNGIEVLRLKNKMGTRALPTAELKLKDTKAFLISEQGIKAVSAMLNITRLHNAICSVAQMSRGLQLALNYSEQRFAFGKKIIAHALHQKTLFECLIERNKCLYLTLEMARLLGLDETNLATEEDQYLLRLLTPIAKLYTAKKAVSVTAEVLETFGGIGYIENSQIPVLMRDAHVFPLWEGTTNVLSLDVLRVKDKLGLDLLFKYLKVKAAPELHQKLDQFCASAARSTAEQARDLAFAIGDWFCSLGIFEVSSLTEQKFLLENLPIDLRPAIHFESQLQL